MVVCKGVLAFFFLLILVVPVQGADVLVVTEEWPPYTCRDDNGIQGVVTEIVRATLDRSGLDYTIEIYPFARAYDTARTEKNVLIYSIFKLPNREKLFKWIKIEGLSVNMYLFKPKFRTDIVVESLEDARGYRIGVTRETSTHHFLLSKGFVEDKNLFPVNCEVQNMLKSSAEARRIDLSTGDRLSLAHWLKQASMPSDYFTPLISLFNEDFYMAFGNETSDEMVERVRTAFEEIRAEGQLDAIVEKYWRMFQ